MANNDLEFKIRTVAELSGAEAVAKALERDIGKAKAAGKDFSALQTKLSEAQKRISDFKGAGGKSGFLAGINEQLIDVIPGLGKVEGIMAKIASGPLGLLAAGFAALGSALLVAKKGLAEYAETESAVAKLDAALARQGSLTEENRVKLQEYADELQKTTGIEDEAWIAVQARLLQFGSTAEGIGKNVEAVKNLAGMLDGDLQSAALMVGKALQGSFEMFGRYGIHLSETATQAEKLAQLYSILEQRGGGQLEASTHTISGRFRELGNNVKDTLKGIGQWVAETGVVQNVTGGLSSVFESLAERLNHTVAGIDGLSNSFKRNKPTMDDAKKSLESFNEALKESERVSKAMETALQNSIKSVKELQSHEDALADKKKERELAAVDLADKRGMSPIRAAAMRNEIEDRYEKERVDRADKAMAKEDALSARVVQTAIDRKAALEQELKSLEARRKVLADADKQGAEVGQAQKTRDVLSGEYTAAATRLQQLEIEAASGSGLAASQLPVAREEAARLARASEMAGKQYRRQLGRFRESPDTAPGLDTEEKTIKDAIKGIDIDAIKAQAAAGFNTRQQDRLSLHDTTAIGRVTRNLKTVSDLSAQQYPPMPFPTGAPVGISPQQLAAILGKKDSAQEAMLQAIIDNAARQAQKFELVRRQILMNR